MRRFAFIDALRGIAACAVMVFHFAEWLSPLPWWISSWAVFGDLGVPVFFVISGFVIAYSIRDAHITLPYLGHFVLRRAMRLDPAYWTVNALMMLSGWMLVPSVWEIVANLFYLQDFLGAKPILNVSWTLCLEVQLYLSFVVLCGVAQWRRWEGAKLMLIFAPLLIFSIAENHLNLIFHYSFPRWWYTFFSGALAWWCLSGRVSRWWFLMLVPALTIQTHFAVAALLTAAVVFGLGLDRLGSYLSAEPFQFLGRCSYGIYLSHILIGKGALYACRGWELSNLASLSVMCAASILAAHVIHMGIERPGMAAYKRWLAPRPAPASRRSRHSISPVPAAAARSPIG